MQNHFLIAQLTSLQSAIKKIGIGKKKSNRLSSEEVVALYDGFQKINIPAFSGEQSCEIHFPAACGAFFAALFFKKPSTSEIGLLEVFLKIFSSIPFSNKLTLTINEANKLSSEKWGRRAWQLQEELLTKVWLLATKTNNVNTSEEKERTNARVVPEEILQMAVDIAVKQETLPFKKAKILGNFLFQNLERKWNLQFSCADFFCGFFASYLRMRYETTGEWNGLYVALLTHSKKLKISTFLLSQPASRTFALVEKTTQRKFADEVKGLKANQRVNINNSQVSKSSSKAFKKKLAFVFSEPANGFTNTFFLSPLYGAWLQKQGIKALHLVSKNPGPKNVLNLLQLLSSIKMPFAHDGSKESFEQVGVMDNFFGHAVCQEDYCTPVENWRLRRHAIVKRPFFSTLEKFISPLPIEHTFLVTSAFHSPYLEKMISLALFAGFAGVLILKSTREGGLTPSLTRPLVAKLCLRKDFFPSYYHKVKNGNIAGEIIPAKSSQALRTLRKDVPDGNAIYSYATELVSIPVLGERLVKDELVALTAASNAELLRELIPVIGKGNRKFDGEESTVQGLFLAKNNAQENFTYRYARRFNIFVSLLEHAIKRMQ